MKQKLLWVCLFVCIYQSVNGVFPPFNGTVFQGKDGRLEAYLMPAAAANHASFIIQLPNLDLVIAWFAGIEEGRSDVGIATSHLPNGTTQWTDPKIVSQRVNYSDQNPVLFYDNGTNILHLFHTQQYQSTNYNESTATLWHLTSADNGYNWTEPEEMISKPGSYDRNRIIVNKYGWWLYPTYSAYGSSAQQYATLTISKNGGLNWTVQAFPDANDLVQPSITRTPDGTTLIAFFRDRRQQHIYWANSTDEGQTWTDPTPTILPNNNAAIQVITLQSGAFCLVFNDFTHTERTSLTIGLSYDEGKTWPYKRLLEPEPDDDGNSKQTVRESSAIDIEYSYPSLIQDPQGYIHVCYTFDRLCIKYAVVTEEWIKQGLLNHGLLSSQLAS
jgi:predicted neuraminidase